MFSAKSFKKFYLIRPADEFLYCKTYQITVSQNRKFQVFIQRLIADILASKLTNNPKIWSAGRPKPHNQKAHLPCIILYSSSLIKLPGFCSCWKEEGHAAIIIEFHFTKRIYPIFFAQEELALNLSASLPLCYWLYIRKPTIQYSFSISSSKWW